MKRDILIYTEMDLGQFTSEEELGLSIALMTLSKVGFKVRLKHNCYIEEKLNCEFCGEGE